MKYNIRLLCVFLIYPAISLQAQDYHITFKGTSATGNINSVKVENLTQGTSLNLSGDDILHLVKTTTSIYQIKNYEENKVTVYPNPMQEYSLIRFDLPADGKAFIEIITISGNIIFKHQDNLTRGKHFYKIQGLNDGMYLIRIYSNNYSATGRLICTGNFKNNPGISYENTSESSENDIISKAHEENNNSKSISSEVLMQYNPGDRLKFTGISDKYSTIIVKIPTESQIITFDFLPCSDADGNNYQVVRIGEQVLMAENLKTTKLNDGTLIPNITDSDTWKTLTTTAFSWYNNDDLNYKNRYGALYNWFAVNSGKICPDGWHVPNDAEWDILTDYLGGANSAGGKLKETGILNWNSPNTLATNESGFTAIAAGNRDTDGTSVGSGSFGVWWSSTELSPGIPSYRSLYYRNSSIEKAGSKNTDGFSIRCIRDQSKTEEAFPGITGENIDFVIGSDTITCELINGQYVFQGDIILTEEQLNFAKGGGYSSLSKRWPEGIVYYSINDAVPNQSRIYDAIAEYEYKTNNLIKFIKRTDQSAYVEFTRSDNAYSESTSSFLGFISGKQLIKIQDDSKKGVVMHEIGHTIGLIHEHSRKDRDDWVIFYKDNVDEYHKNWKQFSKVNSSIFTEEYDYYSIMGYESGALAKPGLKTTTKKDGSYIYQNRDYLTDLDVEMIKMLYLGNSPFAAFKVSKENSLLGESLQFTDQSSGSPTKWLWNFGDGKISSEQNPKHIYETSGIFTVTLKVYNNFDSNSCTKTDYINIISEKPFFGGQVESKANFKYGRFEVRMRPTKNSGVISSFFTYLGKDNTQEEIDIEFVGNKDAEFTFHYPGETDSTKNIPGSSTFNEEFSIYRFDWTDNYIEWYINNTPVYKVTNEQVDYHLNELTDMQYILMNIWSHMNNWGGSLDISSLPICVEYDWVKYYAWDKPSGLFSSIPDWQDDFNNLDNWIISKSTFSDSAADFVPENVRQETRLGNGYLVLFLSKKGIPIPDPVRTGTFIDERDNVEYKWVKVGNQTWMAENLKSTQYNDGTEIPNVLGSWENLITPSYCWYNNLISNKDKYGAMYNWYAVNTGKLCPVGWHVPSDDEWTILINYAGGETSAGGSLKESGTFHWSDPNTGATDEFGFAALPGGYYRYGNFLDIGNYGMWWSSTTVYPYSKWMRHMYYAYPGVFRGQKDPRDGYSVRCIKN